MTVQRDDKDAWTGQRLLTCSFNNGYDPATVGRRGGTARFDTIAFRTDRAVYSERMTPTISSVSCTMDRAMETV